MADISKVAVQSGVYTLKDIQARNETNRIDENLHQEIANIKSDITTINEDIKDIEEHIKSSGVSSINGEQGDVIITAEKVSAAPIGHVSKEANNTDLGHVRIDETYKAISAPNNSPVVASARALQEAYQELKNHSLPPHASTSTEYGIGTTNKYGHVKISNTYNTPTPENVDGVAASAYAVQSAYNELNDKIEQIDVSTGVQSVNGKNGFNQGDTGGNVTLDADDVNAAPVNHAAILDNKNYGIGDESHYGHVSVNDTYVNTNPNIDTVGAKNGIAASAYALQKAYNELMIAINQLKQYKSGLAEDVYYDNQILEALTSNNVQNAIDELTQKIGLIVPNPELIGDENDLNSIQIGATRFKTRPVTEIYVGDVLPDNDEIKIFVDTSEDYGILRYTKIENSKEGF